jgi:hypothetical protein
MAWPPSAPPTPPSTSDPTNFALRADAFVAWQADDLYQALLTLGTPGLGGGDMTGDLGIAPEVSVASAATCDIGAAASNRIAITGTTTITSFGAVANRMKFIRFTAATVLTHNATSLILPGAGNITTAAGDTCIALSDGSGNWRVYGYVSLSYPTQTPTITFATPGDLSVSYASRIVNVVKRDRQVLIHVFMQFTPTFTTASGAFTIANLLPAAAVDANGLWQVGLNANFSWPASRTQIVGCFLTTTTLGVQGLGSAVAPSSLTAANLTSGVQHSIFGTISYLAA